MGLRAHQPWVALCPWVEDQELLGQFQQMKPLSPGAGSGFLCVSDSDRRVPAELGQESQASSCLRQGTPLAARVAQGVSGPSSSGVWGTKTPHATEHGAQKSTAVFLFFSGFPEGAPAWLSGQ